MRKLSFFVALMSTIFVLPAVAQQAKDVITVSIFPADGGTVTSNTNDIIRSPDFSSYSFSPSSTASFTAVAKTGYKFATWSSQNGTIISTSATLTISSKDYKSIAATFVVVPMYTLNVAVNPAGAGTVTGGGQYAGYSNVRVKATPNTGWAFTNWVSSKTGNVVSPLADYPFTLGEPQLTLTANFRNLDQEMQAAARKVTEEVQRAQAILQPVALLLTANPANGGTVSGGGSFPRNTLINISATPANGFKFMNWTDGKGNIVARVPGFQVSSDQGPLYANFAKTFSVTSSIGGGTMGGGDYPPNTLVQVVATSQPGYVFVNWTDLNGAVLSTSAVFKVNTNVGSIKANFKKL